MYRVMIEIDARTPAGAREAAHRMRLRLAGIRVDPARVYLVEEDGFGRLARMEAAPVAGGHGVSCACCRASNRCNECFSTVTAGTRCTSGRCRKCCNEVCVHKERG